jgi:hypothetical protein
MLSLAVENTYVDVHQIATEIGTSWQNAVGNRGIFIFLWLVSVKEGGVLRVPVLEKNKIFFLIFSFS